jgi:hypothetical protein
VSGDPLIPSEVYQDINADGREWTYDVAWQNTRALTYSIETDQLSDLAEQALVLTARLHRLETARADAMVDGKTARALAALEESVNARSLGDNTARLRVIAPALEGFFDEGDFADAKLLALEVLVISRWLAASAH